MTDIAQQPRKTSRRAWKLAAVLIAAADRAGVAITKNADTPENKGKSSPLAMAEQLVKLLDEMDV